MHGVYVISHCNKCLRELLKVVMKEIKIESMIKTSDTFMTEMKIEGLMKAAVMVFCFAPDGIKLNIVCHDCCYRKESQLKDILSLSLSYPFEIMKEPCMNSFTTLLFS